MSQVLMDKLSFCISLLNKNYKNVILEMNRYTIIDNTISSNDNIFV